MSGSSNIALRPYDYGYQMAKSNRAFYYPYDATVEGGRENNTEFKRGWDAYLRHTAGVAKGKEQPLP